jgi:hypothetical protein
MNGDRSGPDRPEVPEAAGKAASGVCASLLERVSAGFEDWVAIGRNVVIAGNFAHAFLLLAARIWLSQAIFVHQIMMMMRAEGFAEAASAGATLIRSVAPLLLATGLATRPVALILVLGVGHRQHDGPLSDCRGARHSWGRTLVARLAILVYIF